MERVRELIHRYFDDALDEAGLAEMESRLAIDPEARLTFAAMARDHALLMETIRGDADLLMAGVAQPTARPRTNRPPPPATRRHRAATLRSSRTDSPLARALPWAAAAGILLAFAWIVSTGALRNQPAATLAREPSLPAMPPLRETVLPPAAPAPSETHSGTTRLPAEANPILPEISPPGVPARPVRGDPRPQQADRPPDRPHPDPPAPRVVVETPAPPPPAVEEAAIATIDQTQGSVFVLAGTDWRPARAGSPLLPGSGLRTGGKECAAALRLPDGSVIELAPDTEILDRTTPEKAGVRPVLLALERGHLRARVAPRPADRPLAFITPHAETLVIGTSLTLAVTTQATRLDVTEGRVRLTRRTDGLSVEVGANQCAVASPGTPFHVRDRVAILSFQDGLLPTPGYAGTRDTTISRIAEPRPAGVQKSIRACGPPRRGASREACALLRWDLTEIPPGSAVLSASLQLHPDAAGSRPPIEIAALKRPWNEIEATWLVATPILSWDRRGAEGPADRGPVLGSAPPGTGAGPLTIGFSQEGISVVQGWVSRPASNFGLLLASRSAEGVVFCSREHEDASRRPKLTVAFIAPPDEMR